MEVECREPLLRVFVLGVSGSGKSSFAQSLVEALNQRDELGADTKVVHVEASGNFRAYCREGATPEEMAEKGVELLRADPEFFLRKMRATDAEVVVISGVRSPNDFGALFRPGIDFVVVTAAEDSNLDLGMVGTPKSEFEGRGLAAVMAAVDFNCFQFGVQIPRVLAWGDEPVDRDVAALAVARALVLTWLPDIEAGNLPWNTLREARDGVLQ